MELEKRKWQNVKLDTVEQANRKKRKLRRKKKSEREMKRRQSDETPSLWQVAHSECKGLVERERRIIGLGNQPGGCLYFLSVIFFLYSFQLCEYLLQVPRSFP